MGYMRLLFLADGRSPTATSWISYFLDRGDEVHLVSTYRCPADERLASFRFIPAVFSGAAGSAGSAAKPSLLKRMTGTMVRTRFRQWLGPYMLARGAAALRAHVADIDPDLVHAMRIPYEGMLAARALAGLKVPLVVSVWGNDFTLHAASTRAMGRETRRVLLRVDGLLSDTQRDQRLAHEWGFPADNARIVLPGGGGIKGELFFPPQQPAAEPLVIHPRGLRAYIRNDTFFKAIPLVLQKMPQARFICTAMAGQAEAEDWVRKLGLGAVVQLLPLQSREQMAALFRRSQVVASISEHDGTPNSLLEAMACGCFPVAGDIESIREWLRHGENGLLVNPSQEQALAAALLEALQDSHLRETAAQANAALVAERAEYHRVMEQALNFYHQVAKRSL